MSSFTITVTVSAQDELDDISRLIKVKFPHAVVTNVIPPNVELCANIRAQSDKFARGFITSGAIEALVGQEVEIELIDQVRYNGVDLGVKDNDTLDPDWMDEVRGSWSALLCGDMIEGLGPIALLILFGIDPEPEVIEAFRTKKVTCSLLDEDDQVEVFSDYPKFVNDVLNGVCNVSVYYDVIEGYDS